MPRRTAPIAPGPRGMSHPTGDARHAGGAMGDRTRLQRAPWPVAPANALVAIGVVVLAVLGTLTALAWSGSGATSPASQIPGSPAAPTAAEITPVCRTSSPASALGPATSLPAHPTSTVVTPSGGVVNFAATASALYVDTGTHLDTYSLSGAQLGSFALPAHFTGNSASTPVVDPSGAIYLASYYGQMVDKFSPSGALLWSTDPRAGTRPVCSRWGRARRSRSWSAWCRTPREVSSSVRPPGRSPGPSPWSTTASSPRRSAATCSTRPTATWRPCPRRDGCSRPSAPRTSRATASTPGRAPSSTTRPRPSRARTGPSTPPTRCTRSKPRRRTGTSWDRRHSVADWTSADGASPWWGRRSTTRAARPSRRVTTPSRRSH